MPELLSFENFSCPACGTAFSEDEIMGLCAEPFNGVLLACGNCDAQFDAALRVQLVRL